MHKKALLTRFQMVYLNASWIDTVEKLWPFENFEHKNYENGYTIRANTLVLFASTGSILPESCKL